MCQTRRQFLKIASLAGSALSLADKSLVWGGHAETRSVRVRPREYGDAFANPLKGFRPDIVSDGGSGQGLDNPLVTVVRHYIRWNQIEDSAADPADRIREFCDPKWAGIEKRNIKIIPRVYLYWPEKYYWPSDLRAGDYTSPEFLNRTAKFIQKLGEAWDKDPRVAYIETGIVGPCGEQWGPTPGEELRKVIGDTYTAAFPNKLCMIRYPWNWYDYQFGVFWDSWGTRKDTPRMLEVLESPPLRDSWKTRVRGGEISYGFGDPPGNDPNDTMTSFNHADWIECLTRRGHWNHLGWVSYYDWKRPAIRPQAQRLQKAFGYRFVLEEVRFPAEVMDGQPFAVSFTVRNTGSSPFYYQWPVSVAFLDEQTRQPVWQANFENVDLRQWLPGERWLQFADWNSELFRFVLDKKPARYEIAPKAYEAQGRFTVPKSLGKGTFILGLGILDPSGMVPSCRFACMNYFTGGWHPIGRIALGQKGGSTELDESRFQDLATDTTIGYRAS